jgi:hypothetical protein
VSRVCWCGQRKAAHDDVQCRAITQALASVALEQWKRPIALRVLDRQGRPALALRVLSNSARWREVQAVTGTGG